jgi:DNA polymerase III epsilon subunit-like protein
MYLFFDTETTGLPANYEASFKDVDNWPRITQLAWAIYNSEGKQFKKFQSLIKPDGWTIPTVEELKAKRSKNPNFFVENNMSTERCEREGRPLVDALKHFVQAIEETTYIIAHNMSYDLPVTQCEMWRTEMNATNKGLIRLCTKELGTDICRIPAPWGKPGFKWPSLEELHDYLFQHKFMGAHDAMNDVEACANCFFEMKRRNLITIPEPKFISTTHTKRY